MSLKEKIKRIIKNPSWILIYLDNCGIHFLSDEKYIKLLYKLRMNKELNLDNPVSFNEKLQWLKLHNIKPEYVKMVDKYEAKKYVSSVIGEEFIIPTLGVYDKFEDIDFKQLPNQFVIKCTHDSGGIVICKDKKNFDMKKAKRKINKSMKKNYYYGNREWIYKNIKPRIIIEKYMVDESGTELKDYKFFCFNGTPKLLFVATDRAFETKFNFYDMDFNKIPVKQHYNNFDKIILKPNGFEKMVELSKKLSKDIPHVRVDFYDINGKVYFGELTFFHFGGYERFEPDEYDNKIGEMLQLPKE